MLRLAFLGDVMLGRLMNEAASANGPGYFWGDTLPVLRQADLRIINLECVISDKGEPWSRFEKVFHFRALPWAIETLKIAKIDCVSLANNHSLDYEEEALLDMLNRLDEAGIKHAGAGKDAARAAAPAFLEAKGLRIALFSSTDNEPGWQAREGMAGVNFVPTLVRPEVLEKIGRSFREARKAGADVIVYSDHWGPNMRQRPDTLYVSFAHALMDLGADIFHGHSAHLFQGIELWDGKSVLFDTGDFVDDYAVDFDLRNDWSFIFLLDIDEKTREARKITLVPVYISRFQANLAPEPLSGLIRGRMEALCSEMGTRTRREGNNLVIIL